MFCHERRMPPERDRRAAIHQGDAGSRPDERRLKRRALPAKESGGRTLGGTPMLTVASSRGRRASRSRPNAGERIAGYRIVQIGLWLVHLPDTAARRRMRPWAGAELRARPHPRFGRIQDRDRGLEGISESVASRAPVGIMRDRRPSTVVDGRGG
jgi:hypothetical protein